MCDLCQFCECREYCSNEKNNYYGKSETTINKLINKLIKIINKINCWK